MAPRKGKRQGKRNDLKIKSKFNPRKISPKTMKRRKISENQFENLKWMKKAPGKDSVSKSEIVPNWLNSCVYKHQREQPTSSENSSECEDDIGENDLEDKSSMSDASGECDCIHSKYLEANKEGILKRKTSPGNSVVAKYIKSGMDHVASFIVESAIRFGEEHGVVVPDKNSPNVYEIMPPNKSFAEKMRKSRFRVPDRRLDYEQAKKAMWRSNARSEGAGASRRSQNHPSSRRELYESKSSTWTSQADSLEEILPLLERLKKGGKIITSELDIDKLAKSKDPFEHERNRRDRLRERFWLKKRYKSIDGLSKASEEIDYEMKRKPTRKRFRRDSLEL